ncbi:MAG: DUF922 domain-containing protein [bacterium]
MIFPPHRKLFSLFRLFKLFTPFIPFKLFTPFSLFMLFIPFLLSISSAHSAPDSAGAKSPPPYQRHQINVSYAYYEVPGSTFAEVWRRSSEISPLAGDYRGQTDRYLDWKYRYTYDSEPARRDGRDGFNFSIKVANVEISVRHVIHLPCIAPGSTLPSEDRARWDSAITELKDHELDHVALTSDPRVEKKFAEELTSLKSLWIPAEKGLDVPKTYFEAAIEKELNARGDALMKMLNDRDTELDEITDHGRKPLDRATFFREIFPTEKPSAASH